MGQEISGLNLRGVLINPESKPGINYYVCVITLPTLPEGQFPPISVTYYTEPDNSGVLNFTYNGTLPTELTGGYSDYVLPVYASQMEQKIGTSVVLTDINGNYAKGNPNSGQPPIPPINANRDSNYVPANMVFQGAYNRANYFILVMVSTAASATHPTGGYTNVFGPSVQLIETDQGPSLACSMIPSDGMGPRAVIGVFQAAYQQYAYSVVALSDGTTGASWIIDWNNVTTI